MLVTIACCLTVECPMIGLLASSCCNCQAMCRVCMRGRLLVTCAIAPFRRQAPAARRASQRLAHSLDSQKDTPAGAAPHLKPVRLPPAGVLESKPRLGVVHLLVPAPTKLALHPPCTGSTGGSGPGSIQPMNFLTGRYSGSTGQAGASFSGTPVQRHAQAALALFLDPRMQIQARDRTTPWNQRRLRQQSAGWNAVHSTLCIIGRLR